MKYIAILFYVYCSLIMLSTNSHAGENHQLHPLKAEGDKISLDGKWLFKMDMDAKNKEKEPVTPTWSAKDLEDSDWGTLQIGTSWESQKLNFNGQAWYRQHMIIPEEWKGEKLVLKLGKPDDGAHVFFNGKKLGTWNYNNEISLPLPTEDIVYGGDNVIAICVWDNYKNGGMTGQGQSIRKLGEIKIQDNGWKVSEDNIKQALALSPQKAALPGIYSYDKVNKYFRKADIWGGWKYRGVDLSTINNEDTSPAKLDFDDSAWKIVLPEQTWDSLGNNLPGESWYRQKITLPGNWEGSPVVINMAGRGIPSVNGNYARMDDSVYVNGHMVGGFAGEYKFRSKEKQRTYAIPAEFLRFGKENVFAIKIAAPANQGMLSKGALTAESQPYGLMLRYDSQKVNEELPASYFDASRCQSGTAVDAVLRLPATAELRQPGKMYYNINDTFGNVLKSGIATMNIDDKFQAYSVVELQGEQSLQLYLRARIGIIAYVVNAAGELVWSYQQECGPFVYHERDAKQLPAMAETFEDTPYGKLKLVDVVDCALPLKDQEHPYIESSFDKKVKFNEPGSPVDVKIENVLGRNCRSVTKGFFGYRIGREGLKPHKGYIVRIEYPEDKPRYAHVEIANHHSYADVGWKNGVSPTDPLDNYPLANEWRNFDTYAVLDNFTYGTGGTGSAPMQNGLWVMIMDKGKGTVPQYQGGPAVARIKLYEADAQTYAPKITYPKETPRRTFMVDWERQPNENPYDMAQYCLFMGYNAVSPVILKWTFALYANEDLGYSGYYLMPHSRNRVSLSYSKDEKKPLESPLKEVQKSVHEQYLEATKKYNIDYIPRLEYGGSMRLPESAWAIAPDGKIDPAGRYAKWGANLLNPATLADMKDLLDKIVGKYSKDNPQLKGFLWRIRCGRMQVSYGSDDIKLFCKETATPMPKLKGSKLSKWAASNKQYQDWWDKKRAEFHNQILQILKGYDPSMKMLVNLWDTDKWCLGLPGWFTAGNWDQMTKYPEEERAGFYREYVKKRNEFKPEDYAEMIRSGDNKLKRYAFKPHERFLNELYKDPGIHFFAPANYRFLSENKPYLEAFRTGAGLAVSNMVTYDEHVGRYLNPRYETTAVLPAGTEFSMANEVLACFESDPDIITYTSYTFGKGFAYANRRFAQAYLALPATKGIIAQDAVVPADKDVIVRTYPTANGLYVSVISRKMVSAKLTVSIQAEAGKVMDLVSGTEVPATSENGRVIFEVNSGPMQLNSFLLRQ